MDTSEVKDPDAEIREGPMSILYQAAKTGKPVLVACRNDKHLLGRVKAFDRHFNMILEDVSETWVEHGKRGKGQKKAASTVKERAIRRMFLRGDSVILVVGNPKA